MPTPQEDRKRYLLLTPADQRQELAQLLREEAAQALRAGDKRKAARLEKRALALEAK